MASVGKASLLALIFVKRQPETLSQVGQKVMALMQEASQGVKAWGLIRPAKKVPQIRLAAQVVPEAVRVAGRAIAVVARVTAARVAAVKVEEKAAVKGNDAWPQT